MNKKIIVSLSVIAAAAAVVIGGTTAFFSDTETSTGNTFTAGAIDLKVSNQSYYNGVAMPNLSWSATDLGAGNLFFNFADLKPGDLGEDTIDLTVNNNDAYACMDIEVTGTPENGRNEPELLVDTTGGTTEGELQNELHMTFWADDGDNVLELDEEPTIFINNQTIQQISDGGNVTLADSTDNVWTGQAGPMIGADTYYIGKVFCFGNLTQNPVAADAGQNPTVATGFTCSGASVTNASQTDGVTGNVSFTAIQSRNNGSFKCNDRPTVGANLSAYVEPTTCDITVGNNILFDHSTIQAGVDDAATGQTVCVEAGTYTGNVNVNGDITLVAKHSPTSGSKATIVGLVDLTANGATLKGFDVTPGNVAHQEAGVTVAANDITIDSNYIHNIHSTVAGSIKGIYLGDSTGAGVVSNIQIINNKVSDIVETFGTKGAYGIMDNYGASGGGTTTGLVVMGNTVSNLNGGWAHAIALEGNTPGASVTKNDISVITVAGTDSVGVQVEDNTGAGSVAIHTNNFSSTVNFGVQNATGTSVNAENNWWGDTSPADDANGLVDFTPFETSAFLQN